MKFDLTKPIEDYSGFTNADLAELNAAAFAGLREFAAKDKSTLTASDIEGAKTLRTIVDGEAAERAKREEADPTAGLDLAEKVETVEVPAADPPAAPAPAEKVEEKELEVVTASAGPKPAAPRVGEVAANAPEAAGNLAPSGRFPAAWGVTDGQEFASLVKGADYGTSELKDWFDVAKQAERKLATYGAGSGGPRQQHNIATIQREFPKALIAGDDTEDLHELLMFAGKESNLPGGSLTAAAGWCAPSQTVYDLCELETRDGLLDIPEIQISRGGLRFTPGPDFAAIFGGAGYFHQTEAQVIANTTKPCMEIPCPSFQDVRLEVEGVCITGSILQRRGYPELVERFIRGALVAHTHKLNAFKIAAMVTGSTAVDQTAIANNDGNPVVSDTGTTGVLAAVELQITDIRYRHRMGLNQTVEAVFPAWAKMIFRADLSRRMGMDDPLSVTDAMINSFFALRGARVQWVYDWQDAYSGLATGPGGASPLLQLPNTFSFLLYPAGTWVAGVDDVIRLDTVYDSVNLATNRYTALFTEEGILMAKPCGESRLVSLTFNALGVVGGFATGAVYNPVPPAWDATA
jgi:hypothetical protein